jgi:hypothetical protein
MIWQDESLDATAQARLAERLLEDVPSLCGNPALAAHGPLTEAVAGVALYLDRIEIIPEDMDPRLSRDLLAQALDAAGEPGLARRIRLFGNRVIYPARWTACGDRTVWILDVSQLLTPADGLLEMMLFDRVRTVLSTFADVWDATAGEGILALKGSPKAAAALLGPDAKPGRAAALARELGARSRAALEALGPYRNWNTSPDVMIVMG